VFVDSGDSSGNISNTILPVVDLYVKANMLRDRTLYTTPLYDGSLITDTYHRLAGVSVEHTKSWGQIDTANLPRLVLGWNLALSDVNVRYQWGQLGRALAILFPGSSYRPDFTLPTTPRPIDVSYRVGIPPRETIAYQRIQMRDHIAALDTSQVTFRYQGRIPYRDYVAEMQQSRIVPSPFGWGEICYRDFEAFMHGAALLKPDMSHLETWPDLYQPGITYEPVAWDFSNFDEKLTGLLDDPQKALAIAEAGQKAYLKALSPAGGEAFAEHIRRIVDRALAG